MAEQVTLDGRGALQDLISEKAVADDDYRNALLTDPKGLLEKHLGSEIPEWMNVQVVEEKANTIYLIAPYIPSEELADEDLEMVAGGKGKGGGGTSGGGSCNDNKGAFNTNITITADVSVL